MKEKYQCVEPVWERGTELYEENFERGKKERQRDIAMKHYCENLTTEYMEKNQAKGYLKHIPKRKVIITGNGKQKKLLSEKDSMGTGKNKMPTDCVIPI